MQSYPWIANDLIGMASSFLTFAAGADLSGSHRRVPTSTTRLSFESIGSSRRKRHVRHHLRCGCRIVVLIAAHETGQHRVAEAGLTADARLAEVLTECLNALN